MVNVLLAIWLTQLMQDAKPGLMVSVLNVQSDGLSTQMEFAKKSVTFADLGNQMDNAKPAIMDMLFQMEYVNLMLMPSDL